MPVTDFVLVATGVSPLRIGAGRRRPAATGHRRKTARRRTARSAQVINRVSDRPFAPDLPRLRQRVAQLKTTRTTGVQWERCLTS